MLYIPPHANTDNTQQLGGGGGGGGRAPPKQWASCTSRIPCYDALYIPPHTNTDNTHQLGGLGRGRGRGSPNNGHHAPPGFLVMKLYISPLTPTRTSWEGGRGSPKQWASCTSRIARYALYIPPHTNTDNMQQLGGGEGEGEPQTMGIMHRQDCSLCFIYPPSHQHWQHAAVGRGGGGGGAPNNGHHAPPGLLVMLYISPLTPTLTSWEGEGGRGSPKQWASCTARIARYALYIPPHTNTDNTHQLGGGGGGGAPNNGHHAPPGLLVMLYISPLTPTLTTRTSWEGGRGSPKQWASCTARIARYALYIPLTPTRTSWEPQTMGIMHRQDCSLCFIYPPSHQHSPLLCYIPIPPHTTRTSWEGEATSLSPLTPTLPFREGEPQTMGIMHLQDCSLCFIYPPSHQHWQHAPVGRGREGGGAPNNGHHAPPGLLVMLYISPLTPTLPFTVLHPYPPSHQHSPLLCYIPIPPHTNTPLYCATSLSQLTCSRSLSCRALIWASRFSLFTSIERRSFSLVALENCSQSWAALANTSCAFSRSLASCSRRCASNDCTQPKYFSLFLFKSLKWYFFITTVQ